MVQEAAPAMAVGADHSAAGMMADLSAARHVWLSRNLVALLLKGGRLLLAHLTVQAGMVKQIKVSCYCLVFNIMKTGKKTQEIYN